MFVCQVRSFSPSAPHDGLIVEPFKILEDFRILFTKGLSFDCFGPIIGYHLGTHLKFLDQDRPPSKALPSAEEDLSFPVCPPWKGL